MLPEQVCLCSDIFWVYLIVGLKTILKTSLILVRFLSNKLLLTTSFNKQRFVTKMYLLFSIYNFPLIDWEVVFKVLWFLWNFAKLNPCLFINRGVFQSLVEKHFPAPDRDRINRLLGLEAAPNKPKPTPQPAPAPVVHNGNGVEDNANKRKCECNIILF